MQSLTLQNTVNEGKGETAIKCKAADDITQSSSSSSPFALGPRKTKEKEAAANDEIEPIECDNVYVTGLDLSVGTFIKRAAYYLHQKQ